jgi:hypothetical protein
MSNVSEIIGWQIYHQERLSFRAKRGSPILKVKFYHYPSYRQDVEINHFPQRCKLITKEINSLFLFNSKMRTKGIISLERTITVLPIPSYNHPDSSWGNISDISDSIQSKYKESSFYWPLQSQSIINITRQKWFEEENISHWTQSAYHFITTKIDQREIQQERLGAYQALTTGTGDCDELTDLFITITRIRGIPSRRLTGYFITNRGNNAEPHAWSEIFSPEIGWIPIDIALGNLGKHTRNYVILKVEEFNPALPDYNIQTKHTTTVHCQWDRPKPLFTPLYR